MSHLRHYAAVLPHDISAIAAIIFADTPLLWLSQLDAAAIDTPRH